MPPALVAKVVGSLTTVELTDRVAASVPVKNVLIPSAAGVKSASCRLRNRHLRVRRRGADLQLPAGVHGGRQSADAVQLRRERAQRRVVAQAIFIDFDLTGLRQAGCRVGDLHLKGAVHRRAGQTGRVERRARIGDGCGPRDAGIAARALWRRSR